MDDKTSSDEQAESTRPVTVKTAGVFRFLWNLLVICVVMAAIIGGILLIKHPSSPIVQFFNPGDANDTPSFYSGPTFDPDSNPDIDPRWGRPTGSYPQEFDAAYDDAIQRRRSSDLEAVRGQVAGLVPPSDLHEGLQLVRPGTPTLEQRSLRADQLIADYLVQHPGAFDPADSKIRYWVWYYAIVPETTDQDLTSRLDSLSNTQSERNDLPPGDWQSEHPDFEGDPAVVSWDSIIGSWCFGGEMAEGNAVPLDGVPGAFITGISIRFEVFRDGSYRWHQTISGQRSDQSVFSVESTHSGMIEIEGRQLVLTVDTSDHLQVGERLRFTVFGENETGMMLKAPDAAGGTVYMFAACQ